MKCAHEVKQGMSLSVINYLHNVKCERQAGNEEENIQELKEDERQSNKN